METLWLQRSSSDIPWGFRLQGGREYGTLLQVQRVTPGSVASSGLGPGDTIMKIGNANATGLSHNEGQEIIRNSGNILQLTIKKLSASCQPGPMSPNRYNYDSQVSAQLYEQQQQQQQQQQASPRVQQQQQPVSYGHTLSHDQSDQPYRIQIQHTKTPSYGDTNSYNNRNYVDSSSQQAQSYGSPSYQQDYPTYGRQTSQHNRSQSDNYQSYTPQYNTPQYATQTPQYSTQTSRDNSYGSQQQSTPIKIQFQQNTPQQQQSSFSDGYYGANQTHYGSSQPKSPQSSFQTKAPFSPGGSPYYTEEVQSPSYKSPILPGGGTLNRSLSQEQQNQSSPYSPGQYSTLSPTGTYSRNASSDYNQTDYSQTFPRSYSRQSSQPQQSSPYVSEQPQYGSPAKPTFSPSGPSSYNRSTSQQGQTYADMIQQEQPSSSATTTATFSPTRQQIQMNPLSPSSPSYGGQKQPSFLNQQPSYGTQSPQPAYGSQQPSFLNQQPAYGAQSQQPSYGSQQPSYSVQAQPSFGSQPPTPQAVPAAPQYTPPAPVVPAAPAAPPVADFTAFNNSYSPSWPGYGVSPDLSSLSLDSFSTDQDPYSQSQLTEPISVAPPAPPAPDLFIPPPPPPPSGPPPPPPPPIPGSLADWRPDDQKSGSGSTNKQDGPKVPDGLISAMNKPGKKPFSYGIDLNELKQRTSRQSSSVASKKKPVAAPAVGPPSTAPKPGMAKTNVMPGGPPGSGETYKNQSETLRMVQERDASKYQPQSEIDESHIHVNPHGAKGKQSLSFKVLQWMTDTDANEKVEEVPAQPERPKKQRNPLLRHNSEDDEMRFSGLHSKADIPSKAFGRLNSMTSHVDSPPQNTQNDNDGEEEVGNYDQTSIRYKGKFIPSPSFRVLQNWAALDTDVETPAQRRANKGDDEDDGLPDTLSNEEMVDVRYKGGHIPSKVFRSLQKAVGDDTPENAQPVSQNGIKVIKAAPPTTVTKDNAGTDF